MTDETRQFYETLVMELDLKKALTEFFLERYLDEFFPVLTIPDRSNVIIQCHPDQP